MIELNNVWKRYTTKHGPGRWVLKDINLSLRPNARVALIGSNGAGKSTLLRLIGGVDFPTKGTVSRSCRVSWPMGYGGGLQPTLTGKQNAKFVCRIHGEYADIPERLERIEDFAALGDQFDEPVGTYSSGMRSRLQFGMSLVFKFDTYISDEVTAAGDASFRRKSREAFDALVSESGLVMVAHNETMLRRFCDSAILLRKGSVFWYDNLEEAFQAYLETTPE